MRRAGHGVMPGIRPKGRHIPCESDSVQESVMTHVPALRSIGGFFVRAIEHTAFVVAGFVLMVLGLGLGVTMIMLPVGLAIGLLGFAMFVGGMTVNMKP
jgi:hypothetical protein